MAGVTVQSSAWTNPPANQPAINLTDLTVSGGGLVAPLEFGIAINGEKQIVKTGGSTNSLTGAINRKNGVLRINFGNGLRRSITSGVGAILQDQNSVGGFFLGGATSGVITSP